MRKFLAATVLATSVLALGSGGQLTTAHAQEDARFSDQTSVVGYQLRQKDPKN